VLPLYWFKCLRTESGLQRKPRIKTWSWPKSYKDVRFYRDLLFEEELLKESSIIDEEGIKVEKKRSILVLEEEQPTIVQEEAKEEYEIILDLEEKEVESKPTLEVMLRIVS